GGVADLSVLHHPVLVPFALRRRSPVRLQLRTNFPPPRPYAGAVPFAVVAALDTAIHDEVLAIHHGGAAGPRMTISNEQAKNPASPAYGYFSNYGDLPPFGARWGPN